jgi:hypothetical protein
MDNGLLFPYRCYLGKGGTRKGRLSIPIGHGVSPVIGDAGAGKSTPDIVAEDGRKLRQKQSDSTEPMPPRKASLPLM